MGKNEFRQLVRDYFSFTRSERNGMLVLAVLLIFFMIINLLADHIRFIKPSGHDEFLAITEQLKQQNSNPDLQAKTMFDFDPNTISDSLLDLLDIPPKLKMNLIRYRSKGGSFRKPDDMKKLYGMSDSLYGVILPFVYVRKEERAPVVKHELPSPDYHNFDPNTATLEELRMLGFTAYQAGNLVNYRNRGGRFRTGSDLMKVYGMDSLFYREISPWVKIEKSPESKPESKPEKKDVVQMELNRADSVALTSLPGIGPVFAGRIIRYRKALGGYSAAGQLLEIYGMTEEKLGQLTGFVTVDPSLIIPVRVNFADYRTLSMHPYISGDQAGKIIAWRSANGMLSDKKQLLEKNLLDTATFRKVEDYLSCR